MPERPPEDFSVPRSAGERLGKLEQEMAVLLDRREHDRQVIDGIKSDVKGLDNKIDSLLAMHQNRETLSSALRLIGGELWRFFAAAGIAIGSAWATVKLGSH